MPRPAPLDRVVRHLTPAPSDPDLLAAYAARRDPDAFRRIVDRYAPLVGGLCRRALGDPHAAEDAAQATFLALARRPGAVRGDALAGWLCAVARRTCHKAARADLRRAAREAAAARPEAAGPVDDLSVRELVAVLDQEVARLPADARTALLVCYWQGEPQAEAARRLGRTPAAVKGLLERGRARLLARLARRGLTADVALKALLVAPAGLAAVPAGLRAAWHQAALRPPALPPKLPANVGGMAVTAAVLGLGLALVAQGPPAGPAPNPPPPARGPGGDFDPRPKTPPVDPLGDPLPDRALFRVGTTRLQHRGEVQAVAASPDGRLLASYGRDHDVRVWDARDGRPVWHFELPVRGPWALAFSADGKELAAVSRSPDGDKGRGAFRRWDLATGRERPGGRDLAGAGSDFTYHVALAGRADGTFLAAETVGADIHLYSPGDPAAGLTLKGHTGRVMSLCLTPGAKTLVSLGDEGAVRFWTAADGTEVGRCELPPMKAHGLRGNLAAVAASPDGKTVAVSLPDGSTRLLDPTGREVRRLPTTEQLGALAFSPDGRALFTGGRLVEAWAMADARPIALPAEARHPVRAVAVSPDGRVAAAADDGDRLRLVEVATGRVIVQRQLPCRGGIAFDPRGRWLAVSPGDETVGLWDVAKLPTAEKPAAVIPCQARVGGLAFSPDGKRLATVEGGTHTRIYDVASKGLGLTIKPPGRSVYALALSADGKLLATMGEGRTNEAGGSQAVRLWDSGTGKEVPVGGDVRRLAHTVVFHPNAGSLAGLHLPAVAANPVRGGFDRPDTSPVEDRMETVRLWDIGSGRETARFEDPVQRKLAEQAGGWVMGRSRAVPAAFSPDGCLFAAPGPGGIVVFETASGRPRLRLGGHLQEVTALAFTPDGQTLISASDDSTVLIWDVPGLRTGPRPPGGSEEYWALLADADAGRAGRAVFAMAASPSESLQCLRDRLKPVRVSPGALRRLVADLDDPKFPVRERAGRDLAALGPAAEAALRTGLGAGPSPEAASRIEKLLAGIRAARPDAEQLRAIRAVEVLGRIGSRGARDFLRELAGGAEGAVLTTHACEALERVSLRLAPEAGR